MRLRYFKSTLTQIWEVIRLHYFKSTHTQIWGVISLHYFKSTLTQIWGVIRLCYIKSTQIWELIRLHCLARLFQLIVFVRQSFFHLPSSSFSSSLRCLCLCWRRVDWCHCRRWMYCSYWPCSPERGDAPGAQDGGHL